MRSIIVRGLSAAAIYCALPLVMTRSTSALTAASSSFVVQYDLLARMMRRTAVSKFQALPLPLPQQKYLLGDSSVRVHSCSSSLLWRVDCGSCNTKLRSSSALFSLRLHYSHNPPSSSSSSSRTSFLHHQRKMSSTSATTADNATDASQPTTTVIPGRPTWQQTMLRIADPTKSVPFYTDIMGMTLIDKFDFPQYKFTLYFLTTIPKEESYKLTPGTQEAHDYLWSMEGVALELTHNHGTPQNNNDDTQFKEYHPGNQENDGFGHIAFNCDDVNDATALLEKANVSFKKKPNEGRMKGLAFAYDPDGYWIEIVRREPNIGISNYFNLSQTMLRIKDPKLSLHFYQRLGMKLISEQHHNDFSLYFLASSNVKLPTSNDNDNDNNKCALKSLFYPVLELTHNHGTESDENCKYYNGNEEARQGFGHLGFLVDNVYKACDDIETMGYGFKKEPDGGSMKGLAFAYDPDGYSVEIIKRGGIDFGDKKAS